MKRSQRQREEIVENSDSEETPQVEYRGKDIFDKTQIKFLLSSRWNWKQEKQKNREKAQSQLSTKQSLSQLLQEARKERTESYENTFKG